LVASIGESARETFPGSIKLLTDLFLKNLEGCSERCYKHEVGWNCLFNIRAVLELPAHAFCLVEMFWKRDYGCSTKGLFAGFFIGITGFIT